MYTQMYICSTKAGQLIPVAMVCAGMSHCAVEKHFERSGSGDAVTVIYSLLWNKMQSVRKKICF